MKNTHNSVKKLNWALKEVPNDQVALLQYIHQLDEILARILVIKNIAVDQVIDFLNPSLKQNLPDPQQLMDMSKAVTLVTDAILNQEKIVIFGDYDVDGATSSALLAKYFDKIKALYQIYIPDRIKEGYGPSVEAFTKFRNEGAKLIITVDCGTSAFAAMEFASNNNLPVIIIDHHLSSNVLAQAAAIINPNRFDEQFIHKNLAAVGVAFLFLVALNAALRKTEFFKNNEPNLIEFLDIVALGTVCDVVPLTLVNRLLVQQGLKVFNQKKSLLYQAFSKVFNLKEPFSTYHLGYIIGPRINAGGRIGDCSLGVKLLTADNLKDMLVILAQLNDLNQERQSIEQIVYEQAVKQINTDNNDKIIMVIGENWHPGVIGIVAGRIKEAYSKPVAVISLIGDQGKASCRSTKIFDFGDAVVKAKDQDLLINGGGHKMAAGFTVAKDKISALKEFFEQSYQSQINENLNEVNINYFDSYLIPESINFELFDQLNLLAPFGQDNFEPRFMLKNCKIVKQVVFGANHVSCLIIYENPAVKFIKAIAFRALDQELGLQLMQISGKQVSLIGYLRCNYWNGKKNLEFIIDDLIL